MRWFWAFMFPTVAIAGLWGGVLSYHGEPLEGDVHLSSEAFKHIQNADWLYDEATDCFHYPYDKDTLETHPITNLEASQILRAAGLTFLLPRMKETDSKVMLCLKVWLE